MQQHPRRIHFHQRKTPCYRQKILPLVSPPLRCYSRYRVAQRTHNYSFPKSMPAANKYAVTRSFCGSWLSLKVIPLPISVLRRALVKRRNPSQWILLRACSRVTLQCDVGFRITLFTGDAERLLAFRSSHLCLLSRASACGCFFWRTNFTLQQHSCLPQILRSAHAHQLRAHSSHR